MAHIKPTQIDPGREHLGKIYAKALLAAAQRAGEADAVVEQLESLVGDVLENQPSLAAFLAAPRVSLESKLQVLERAFAGKMASTLLNFLKVVARRQRMGAIREMAIALRQAYNAARGIVDVVVIAAKPLDSTVQQRVHDALAQSLNQKVSLFVETDPELLGGIIIRIGDRVYDGSVVAQLNRMRQQVRENTFQQIRSAIERFAESA